MASWQPLGWGDSPEDHERRRKAAARYLAVVEQARAQLGASGQSLEALHNEGAPAKSTLSRMLTKGLAGIPGTWDTTRQAFAAMLDMSDKELDELKEDWASAKDLQDRLQRAERDWTRHWDFWSTCPEHEDPHWSGLRRDLRALGAEAHRRGVPGIGPPASEPASEHGEPAPLLAALVAEPVFTGHPEPSSPPATSEPGSSTSGMAVAPGAPPGDAPPDDMPPLAPGADPSAVGHAPVGWRQRVDRRRATLLGSAIVVLIVCAVLLTALWRPFGGSPAVQAPTTSGARSGTHDGAAAGSQGARATSQKTARFRFDGLGVGSNVIVAYAGPGASAADRTIVATYYSGNVVTVTCKAVGRRITSANPPRSSDVWVRVQRDAGSPTTYATLTYGDISREALAALPTCPRA